MIPDPPAIGLFVVAALALLLVPGPAVLYIVARSIHEGRRAGLVSVLGIHVGTQGIVVNVLASGTAGGMLRRSRHFVRTQRYVTGTVYIGLGVATAFAGPAEAD